VYPLWDAFFAGARWSRSARGTDPAEGISQNLAILICLFT